MDKTREEFELWLKQMHGVSDFSFVRSELTAGQYLAWPVRLAWDAWQEARATELRRIHNPCDVSEEGDE